MKCRRHPYEGGVGVCAPCLRDRLLALAAAQNEASSLPPPPRAPQPLPEPVPAFPRSVSPYVCRRKSDASSGARRRAPSLLFFRTPQVGPAYSGGGFEEGDIEFEIRRRSNSSSKFSVLAALFGGHRRQHGSEEKDGGGGGGKERRHHRSWLAAIMPSWGHRKKDPVAALPPRRSCHVICNRGLSPVMRYADEGGGDEGSSPAETPWWRPSPSPMRKTPCRRRLGSAAAGAGVSGFAVCISPLVRPSPARHHPPDAAAFSGELGPSPLHRLSSGSSLHHCRSWKLADGGRFR